MTTLEEIRAEIVARRTELLDRVTLAEAALAKARRGIAMADVELMAHDRAAALLRLGAGVCSTRPDSGMREWPTILYRKCCRPRGWCYPMGPGGERTKR